MRKKFTVVCYLRGTRGDHVSKLYQLNYVIVVREFGGLPVSNILALHFISSKGYSLCERLSALAKLIVL